MSFNTRMGSDNKRMFHLKYFVCFSMIGSLKENSLKTIFCRSNFFAVVVNRCVGFANVTIILDLPLCLHKAFPTWNYETLVSSSLIGRKIFIGQSEQSKFALSNITLEILSKGSDPTSPKARSSAHFPSEKSTLNNATHEGHAICRWFSQCPGGRRARLLPTVTIRVQIPL